MRMKSQDAKFAAALFGALVGLVPGGSHAKDFASPILERILSNNGRDADLSNLQSILRRKADEIVRLFRLMEEDGRVNPGSGYASAFDLISIVEKAKLTPRLLIELRLDTDLLWEHLQKVGAPELAEASTGRRARVTRGLREVAETVLEIAP